MTTFENIYTFKVTGGANSEQLQKNPVKVAYPLTHSSEALTEFVKSFYKETRITDPAAYVDLLVQLTFIDPNTTHTFVDEANQKFITAYKLEANPYNQMVHNYRLGSDSVKDIVSSELSKIMTFKDTVKLTHRPNEKKFLKACKLLYPNLVDHMASKAATYTRMYVENIWANIGEDGAKHQQKVLYLLSLRTGGVGKGYLMERLKHFADTYNLPSYTMDESSDYINQDAAKALMSFMLEFTPPNKYKDGKMIRTLNNIIENALYRSREPYRPEVEVKSNTTLCIGSNFRPFDTNDRRYGVVEFDTTPYFRPEIYELSDHERETFHTDWTFDDWDIVIKDLFESCPFGKIWSFDNKATKKWYYDEEIIEQARKTLSNEAYAKLNDIDYHLMTVKQFADAIYYTNLSTDASPKDSDRITVKKILQSFVAKALYKPFKPVCGNNTYGKFDWVDMLDHIGTSEEEYEGLSDLSNLDRCTKEWDNLIGEDDDRPTGTDEHTDEKAEATEESTDKATSNEPTKEELESLKQTFCKDKFDIGHFNLRDDDQFIVTAQYKPDYCKAVVEGTVNKLDRKQEHMLPTQYVFESDELSLDEQRAMYEPIKDKALSITYSGSKSVHCLVPIPKDEQELVAKDFKTAWTIAANKLFGSTKSLDSADASIGRLSRLPNGLRDNGKRQTCEWWNLKAAGISVKDELEDYLKEQAQIKAAQDYARKFSRQYVNHNDKPLIEQLRAIVAKTNNESGRLALDILDSGSAAKGSNMIGAIGYIARLAKTNNKWYDLGQQLVDICHTQHPSNIGKKDFSKFVN